MSRSDDVGQKRRCHLLGLEMASLDNQQIGMTEPRMIVHLSCEIGIDTKSLCFGDKIGA